MAVVKIKVRADEYNTCCFPHHYNFEWQLISHLSSAQSGFDEYKIERGTVAMEFDELLPINVTASKQHCEIYGIHHKLPVLQSLYEKGEASFIAGIGVMTELVTKDNYSSKTLTHLFAHDQSELISDILKSLTTCLYQFCIDNFLNNILVINNSAN